MYVKFKMKNNTNNDNKTKTDDVIDLASVVAAAASEVSPIYVCDTYEGNIKLIPHPQETPFSGPSYVCPSCGTVTDSSLTTMRHMIQVKPSLVRRDLQLQDTDIDFIEDKGFPVQDEYERFDVDTFDDERLRSQGFEIVETTIELVDSSGRNRTIVKRDSDNSKPIRKTS